MDDAPWEVKIIPNHSRFPTSGTVKSFRYFILVEKGKATSQKFIRSV